MVAGEAVTQNPPIDLMEVAQRQLTEAKRVHKVRFLSPLPEPLHDAEQAVRKLREIQDDLYVRYGYSFEDEYEKRERQGKL